MRWFFYVFAALFLLAAVGAVSAVASDIQIIIVAVFIVGSLMCLGFATILKFLEEQRKNDK